MTEVVHRITHDCLIVPSNSFKLKIGSFLERVKYYKFAYSTEKKEQDDELSQHDFLKKVFVEILIQRQSKTSLVSSEDLQTNRSINSWHSKTAKTLESILVSIILQESRTLTMWVGT